jgi:hypothetical protein
MLTAELRQPLPLQMIPRLITTTGPPTSRGSSFLRDLMEQFEQFMERIFGASRASRST